MTTRSTPDPFTPDQRPDVEGRSVGELVSEITEDFTRLLRKEIELAKVEARQEVAKLGKAAGMLAGAGVAGHVVLLFLSVAAMLALGRVMDLDWAALIVAAVWAGIAAILAINGRRRLRSVDPKLEDTTQTLKEDLEWAKTLRD